MKTAFISSSPSLRAEGLSPAKGETWYNTEVV